MDTATTEIYTLSLHDALPIFTATAGGFLSASVTVNGAPAPRLDVAPPAVLLEVGRSAQVTVGGSVPAPPGGLQVTLIQSNPGVVNAPGSVTIPEGASQVQATVTGAA